MATKKDEQARELVYIQSNLKAPKNQRNNFGGYNYRSTEDIMEAVKPLLKETNCVLVVSDEIVLVGDRYYVKATATLTTQNGETWSNTAYAREAADKKGMDAAQVTGAASSYARKYALSGLFCLDDNKDPDVTNNAPGIGLIRNQAQPQPTPQPTQQANSVVTIETVKGWIAKATKESDLMQIWKATPDTLKAEAQPLLTARKNELKGGAK